MTQHEIELLKKNNIIPSDADEYAIQYFVEVCKRKKLDPFLGHVWLARKYNYETKQYYYITLSTIDGMRAIAQRNVKITECKRYVKEINGELYGCCEIKSDRGSYYDEVPYSEYVQTNEDNQPTMFWRKMPQTLLKKCAEASVYRMLCPEDLSDVYTVEEMMQADNQTQSNTTVDGIITEITNAETVKELEEIKSKYIAKLYSLTGEK